MNENKKEAVAWLKTIEATTNDQVPYVLIALTHAVLSVQEELERMNNQELKVEEREWSKVIRKVDP